MVRRAIAGIGAAVLLNPWLFTTSASTTVVVERSSDEIQEDNPPEKIVIEIGGDIKMEFVRIKAGKFTMGGAKSGNEKPPHEVTISKDFWMQTTEVTQEQYDPLMWEKPSYFKGGTRPVECVSWHRCQGFAKTLSEKAKAQLHGMTVGLPTEAEWEYACRAGSTTEWSFGDDAASLGDYAWTMKNSDGETHPVGQKKPNAWGLYDMHGNVEEWCQDYYEEKYSADAVVDPTGPAKGELRVVRGGSGIAQDQFYTRSASRAGRDSADRDSPKTGFRLVLRPAP